MANAILHIKDSYFFEVPKSWWKADFAGIKAASSEDGGKLFPDWLVRVDQEFLDWQAGKLAANLESVGVELPGSWLHDYHHWLHSNHANVGRPFADYLESSGLLEEKLADKEWADAWGSLKSTGSVEEFKVADTTKEWGQDKIDGYNKALSGKILIPQPFGELKNLHASKSGVCISKFMILEVIVAILCVLIFTWLARTLKGLGGGDGPKGRLANMLEVFVVFIRDDVAHKAIGHGYEKFVPILCSVFFFILGMNLMGMIPFMGAPTSGLGCTWALATVIFGVGLYYGSKKFGPVGFWLNQVPSMDLPPALGIPIKSGLFLVEVLGLFIKHAVLGVRLLANMFAGHLVLLGIMAIAFSAASVAEGLFLLKAPLVIIGATLFSVMEFGVAFLQAYIFTFLSALFIGAATHHH